MEIFDRYLGRGEKIHFRKSVASFPDGSPICIDIKAIRGEYSGPIISMLGVQHGDEYNGMEVINKLLDCLESIEVSGSVIGVPVSNPLAFNTGMRVTPPSMGYENLNLNRVWPGNSDGLLMEKIASLLWENIIINSDYVIDLHEGGRAFMARYIHARGTKETDRLVGGDIRKLYRFFGQGIPVLGGIRTRTLMMGSLSVQAGLNGIPCIGPELGGGSRIWNDFVEIGVQGLKNVMIGLGMIPSEPVGANLEQITVQASIWPKTKSGGILYNKCELGDIVEKGETLGELKDTTGRLLEEVIAPYRSVILDTRYLPTVYPGDWTFHCGKMN